MESLGDGLAAVGYQAGLVGLLSGLLLGYCARMGDFCTLGALEMAFLGRDYRRLHVWAVALATAILGLHLAAATGHADIGATFYHSIAWNPVASIAGGLVFGYGMALAGNCGFGALTRAGGGDIRSLIIVIVLGIASFFTLSGPLGPLRARLFPQDMQTGPSGIAQGVAAVSPMPATAVAVLIAVALLAWGLSHPAVRRPATVAWAAGVGLAVVVAIVGTSAFSHDSMQGLQVEGPSFTAPVGRAILYLMTSTGTLPSFSVGSVIGTLLGAFLATLFRGAFRWEACDDPRELGRQMGGAVLMGMGGVVAMGCAIGQGLTGFATLAWSGPVTLAAISAGAYVGLQHLVAAGRV